MSEEACKGNTRECKRRVAEEGKEPVESEDNTSEYDYQQKKNMKAEK